jgi:hypothetical protein
MYEYHVLSSEIPKAAVVPYIRIVPTWNVDREGRRFLRRDPYFYTHCKCA